MPILSVQPNFHIFTFPVAGPLSCYENRFGFSSPFGAEKVHTITHRLYRNISNKYINKYMNKMLKSVALRWGQNTQKGISQTVSLQIFL